MTPTTTKRAPSIRRGAPVAMLSIVSVALTCALVASLSIGARTTSLDVVWAALTAFDPSNPSHVVIADQRMARTFIGMVAGACLAVAGVLMQGVTRNPLADPGLMGVSAGGSVAVLVAISVCGVRTPMGYVWFAFGGAMIAALAVLVIGARGADGGDPARLVLTGAAVNAGLNSVALLILTTDTQALGEYRFWSVGSLTGRDLSVVATLAPFVVAGLVLAAVSAPRLNMMALGDESAAALGHNIQLTRWMAVMGTVLLCGSATSMAGPLIFVGLVVPHGLRSLGLADHRWLTLMAAPGGATLVLVADVVGRVIAPPGEVEAGMVIAAIGAPVLIALVRRRGVRAP